MADPEGVLSLRPGEEVPALPDPARSAAAEALASAFPLDAATRSGTFTLFNPAPDRPVYATDLAGRLTEVDHASIVSLVPEDFRIYLPGWLIGCLCHLPPDGPPYAESALMDLIWGNDDRYWDDRFLARWGGFTSGQIEAVAQAADLLLPEPPPEIRDALFARLGPTDRARARETLDLLRLRLALGRA